MVLGQSASESNDHPRRSELDLVCLSNPNSSSAREKSRALLLWAWASNRLILATVDPSSGRNCRRKPQELHQRSGGDADVSLARLRNPHSVADRPESGPRSQQTRWVLRLLWFAVENCPDLATVPDPYALVLPDSPHPKLACR